MINSFRITPEYFKLPEDHKVARESGIEDRFKEAFVATDSNFSLYKDDYSDGLLRYTVNNEVLFYGVQECKKASSTDVYQSRIIQALSYVCDWTTKYPEVLSKFKVIILPTEKQIDILYIGDLIKSAFWHEFCFYYSEHKLIKGNSASNFYKRNLDVQVLITEYIDRIPASHYAINNELDLKIVTEEILKNCL